MFLIKILIINILERTNIFFNSNPVKKENFKTNNLNFNINRQVLIYCSGEYVISLM